MLTMLTIERDCFLEGFQLRRLSLAEQAAGPSHKVYITQLVGFPLCIAMENLHVPERKYANFVQMTVDNRRRVLVGSMEYNNQTPERVTQMCVYFNEKQR
jgi:hypothetical protein